MCKEENTKKLVWIEFVRCLDLWGRPITLRSYKQPDQKNWQINDDKRGINPAQLNERTHCCITNVYFGEVPERSPIREETTCLALFEYTGELLFDDYIDGPAWLYNDGIEFCGVPNEKYLDDGTIELECHEYYIRGRIVSLLTSEALIIENVFDESINIDSYSYNELSSPKFDEIISRVLKSSTMITRLKPYD